LTGLIEQTANHCKGCALLGELSPRALDVIAGAGERISARIAAARSRRDRKLRGIAFDATELIVTDEVHGGARPQAQPTREKTRAALLPHLAQGAIPVVTGLHRVHSQRSSDHARRGGSDFSATILGAALDAEEVIIWTDVNGVLTADPRMVPEARTLDEVSYSGAGELAFFAPRCCTR